MVLKCIAGFFIAAMGMLVAFGLARWAANIVIILIGIGICLFVVYQIANQEWTGWIEICTYSFLAGAAGAVLSLPVFPFSGFSRKK